MKTLAIAFSVSQVTRVAARSTHSAVSIVIRTGLYKACCFTYPIAQQYNIAPRRTLEAVTPVPATLLIVAFNVAHSVVDVGLLAVI